VIRGIWRAVPRPASRSPGSLCRCDGGFRPDGTFVRWPGWPAFDGAALGEAFRRAALRLFVRRGFFDEDQAEAMLQWAHSGFRFHAGVGVSRNERPFALRLARYCARSPLDLDRLTYEPATEQLTQRSRGPPPARCRSSDLAKGGPTR